MNASFGTHTITLTLLARTFLEGMRPEASFADAGILTPNGASP
jgi:hypothetical protein